MAFLTTGTITERLRAMGYDVTRDRVTYLLRRARVEPEGRAGIVRVFTPAAITVVQQALDAEAPVANTPARTDQASGSACGSGPPIRHQP